VENIWLGSRVVLVYLKIFRKGKELILIFLVRFSSTRSNFLRANA
jgi:hypothetical protein